MSKPLPEVTIRAERTKLFGRVLKFVDQIAIPENGGDGGLVRWVVPSVCPLVSGLPRNEGEFILERLSEIARAAQVPLASEHCRPNLYILVTPQPEDLLKGMEKRNRAFTFGFDSTPGPFVPTLTPASVVDQFIATPRAVRVWYNTVMQTPDGDPTSQCDIGPLLYGKNLGPIYVPCNTWSQSSHLALNMVSTLRRVFVVVDQQRLQGVSRGQLADYVSLVGLAKLNPDAHLGDAETILRLFDKTPRAAPAGLTDWDQAFLKSLYATEQKLRTQRGLISHEMVREIIP